MHVKLTAHTVTMVVTVADINDGPAAFLPTYDHGQILTFIPGLLQCCLNIYTDNVTAKTKKYIYIYKCIYIRQYYYFIDCENIYTQWEATDRQTCKPSFFPDIRDIASARARLTHGEDNVRHAGHRKQDAGCTSITVVPLIIGYDRIKRLKCS